VSEDRDVDRPLKCTVLFLASGQLVRMRRRSVLLVGAVMLVQTTIPLVPVFCPTVVWCLATFVWHRRARRAAVSVGSTTLMISISAIAFGAARDAGALPLLGVRGKWKSKHKCDRRRGGNEAVTHRTLPSAGSRQKKKHQRQRKCQTAGERGGSAAMPSQRCTRREAICCKITGSETAAIDSETTQRLSLRERHVLASGI
jgi:hypothetical protein